MFVLSSFYISSGAKYWPYKNILTSKFSYLLFPNPTHKTKTGTANRWKTTNSNSPGSIKLSSQPTIGVWICCAFYLFHATKKNPNFKCYYFKQSIFLGKRT